VKNSGAFPGFPSDFHPVDLLEWVVPRLGRQPDLDEWGFIFEGIRDGQAMVITNGRVYFWDIPFI
jgi:hypothetical protein